MRAAGCREHSPAAPLTTLRFRNVIRICYLFALCSLTSANISGLGLHITGSPLEGSSEVLIIIPDWKIYVGYIHVSKTISSSLALAHSNKEDLESCLYLALAPAHWHILFSVVLMDQRTWRQILGHSPRATLCFEMAPEEKDARRLGWSFLKAQGSIQLYQREYWCPKSLCFSVCHS